LDVKAGGVGAAALAGAVLLVGAGTAADVAGWAAPGQVLTFLALPFVMMGLFSIGSVVVSAVGRGAGLILAVVLWPVLLIPGVRHWWRGDSGASRGAPIWVPADSLDGAWLGEQGDAVVVTVRFRTGATVAYRARQQAGIALRDGFAGLLRGRLARGVG